VKIGGDTLSDESSLSVLLKGFAGLSGCKILVHGGGRLATEMLSRLGIVPRMVEGRRITDFETLKVVTMVYGGWVNKLIVSRLQSLGISALGLTGADMNIIRSVRRPVTTIDYGFVGDISRVDGGAINFLISRGIIPVLSPLTHDGHGNLLNTNADTIASEVAKAMVEYYKVTLIYCFERSGVLLDERDDTSVIPSIDRATFEEYRAGGVISGGMIPKLETAFGALEAGVDEVVITKASALGTEGGTRVRTQFYS
jgi:acetylglutamate kinase